MADLSGVTDKYFTIASETFTDNLSSSISAGAATVSVLNNSEYTNGDDVVLTVDPGTVNEATFIGRKSGLNFINCVWTEGDLAVGHSNGATIIDYDSATHHNAQTKGIQQFANSNGTLKTQPVRDALGLGAVAANGWEVSPYTYSVTSGYNKGNREFDITVANADVTSVYSVGQKLRLTRGTIPGTQCANFVLASSQYASRASGSVTGTISTFTDDITTEAWINPTTYGATDLSIVARYDGANNGWGMRMRSDGRIGMFGGNAGTSDEVNTRISANLNMWTHIAGQMDMSANTGAIYFNGVSVPVVLTSTAATAWVNGGPLEIGGYNGAAAFFNGKISDVRVWNIIRTQTQIRDNMYQALVGTETNLVGYWKLNGDFVDSTTSVNTLTASGGVAATTLDHPHKLTEYAVIVKMAYGAPNTTVTVQTAQGYGIPNQTLTAPYYSAQADPYGFPTNRTLWDQIITWRSDFNTGAVAANVVTNMGSMKIDLPTGAWDLGYDVYGIVTHAGAGFLDQRFSLSTSTSVFDSRWNSSNNLVSGAMIEVDGVQHALYPAAVTTQTPYYLLSASAVATTTQYLRGTTVDCIIRARFAYV
jgi:hypothetical protein